MLSSRSKIAFDVFVGFLALFYIRDGVGESFDPEVAYLFLYAFISFVVARNVICGIFIFIAQIYVLAGSVA
jgi:hypothetical protein